MPAFVSQVAHLLDVFLNFQLQRLSDHPPRPLSGQLAQCLRNFCSFPFGIIRDKLQHSVSFPWLLPVLGLITRRIRYLFFSCQSTTFGYTPGIYFDDYVSEKTIGQRIAVDEVFAERSERPFYMLGDRAYIVKGVPY